MADAGSRVGSPPHDKMWSNFSFDWQQIPVPFSLRKIYSTFSTNFNRKHWPLDQGRSTRPHGNDGQSGAPPTVSMNGYTQKCNNSPFSSPYLQSTTGTRPRQRQENHYPRKPCCPLLATSLGIISEKEAIRSASTLDTSWPCTGCKGCHHRQGKSSQSHLQFSEHFVHDATSEQPTIAC
ncbi:hypothetical protein L915_16152 [Phytophthora nicotianae]|uniref:Uncharacterized protein n=2 Tax=Phytophthora nicotianae TaxID=4792 RepID=W2G3H4_PHYNI|nr:hypothetical protein L915_16152 [Phytophthora nicotianae]